MRVISPFLWMHWIRTCIVMFNWVPMEVEFNKLSVLLTCPPSWVMSKLIPNHRASNFLNYRPRNCRKFTCTYTRLLIMAHMKSESTVSNKKKISRMMVARPACNAYFFKKIVAYLLFILSKRPSCIVVSSCINPAEYPSRLLSTSSGKFHY